jgi:hypothetical protein
MPAVLGGWFDQHDFAKNVIGYGVFAFTGFVAWSWPANVPRLSRRGYSRRSLTFLFGFCALVLVLELGQLALPYRTCDFADVLAGWTGILLAWAILQIARFILSGGTVRQASSQPHPATTD